MSEAIGVLLFVLRSVVVCRAMLSFEEEGEVEVEMSGAELSNKCSRCFVRRQARPGKCCLCVDCLVYLSEDREL